MRLQTNIGLALLLAFAATAARTQEPPAPPTPAPAPSADAPVTVATEDGQLEIDASALPPLADGEVDVAGEAFARMDSDRDGLLSLEEFEKGIARPRGSQGEGVIYQKLPARFRALDHDTSGYLEAAEFAQMLQRWRGPGPAPGALAPVDRSGDGRIDFREFAALMAPRETEAGEPEAGEPASAATP